MSHNHLTALDHVELTLPEPKKASEYYQRVFGLQEMGAENGVIYLSCQPYGSTTSSAGEVHLKKGEHLHFDRIAFSTNDHDKLQTLETPGADYEIEVCLPTKKIAREKSNAPFGIHKLGHVTFKDPNPAKVKALYESKLGFKLSDQLSEQFFWLRFNHEHHNVAVNFGKSPGVHHIAYELDGWGEVKHLCDHFREQGVQVEFGPGRHGPGNNIFIYVVDPFGLRFEFFCELAQIENEKTYEPKDWAGGRMKNANTWGPKPPESFMREE